jgi:uncharacterized cupin superfamily protein
MISLDIVIGMNLQQPTWDAQVDAGDGATLRAVRLARHAGSVRLAANLYELEPGAVVSPLHFHHHNEELLFVLSGTPTLRRSDNDLRDLVPGEVVAFPAGPAGQHQILNRSRAPARVLICATNDLPEVAEQPENQMLAILTATGLRLVPDAPYVHAS